MSITALIKVTFTGRDGSGTVSVPDVLAGDIKLAIYSDPTADVLTNTFGTAVVTDGELNQIFGGDLSGNTYTAVFLRMC